MWKRIKSVDVNAAPADLCSLSDDTASVVATWLSRRDLRHVVFASKRLLRSALYQVYCRDHLRLRVPTGSQDGVDAVAACKRVHDAHRTLPTRVVSGIPSQLASVLTAIGIQDTIRLVEVAPVGFSEHPDRIPKDAWTTLRELVHFRHLRHLVITGTYYWMHQVDALDVAVIATAVPTLESFSVSQVQLQHEEAFASFQRLRRLELLYVRQFSSWDFGAKLTHLEHFTWRISNSATDDINLTQWRPLKVIELENTRQELMDAFCRAIELVHLPVLEKLQVFKKNAYYGLHLNLAAQPSPRLIDLTIAPNFILGGVHSLAAMTQLRSLHVCWDDEFYVRFHDYGVGDTSPLACLVNLETLKLRMSRRATTCRPLQALTRLRELHLVDGWLRDFVEWLPHLEKLSVEEIGEEPRVRTFQERLTGRSNRHGGRSMLPRLREVFIGNSVVLNGYAMRLIQGTRSLRLDMEDFAWEKLFQVNHLPYLKSFEFRQGSLGLTLPSRWQGQRQVLSSIHTLENLRLDFCHSPLLDLPWSLAGASRLRVISLVKVGQGVLETLAERSTTLVQLEEIYLERYEGKSLAPLLELHTLRIVGIHHTVDCRRLRGARGIDGALPNLRSIIHEGIDCMWLATCPVARRSEKIIQLLGVH